MTRIQLIPNGCVGHGQCNAVAPEVYGLDEDGYCVPQPGDVPAQLMSRAVDGAKSCPERAIVLGPGVGVR
jgi:ferredoxin